MREQVAQVCEVMLASGALCPVGPPGLCELATRVLTQHASRLSRQADGPVPPWLALPVLTAEAVGSMNGATESVRQASYHVAAAWELGNLAAGCLDAWQDEDTDDALWREIGPAPAVNLAVGLIALSSRMLTHLADLGLVPLSTVVTLKRGFEDTLLRMVQGQHADLTDDLVLDDYAAVAVAKTGSLFRLACWSGAVIAGARAEVAERYGAFGESFGLMVQAWNDLYGLEGALGKQDAGHRRTLPILTALALDERSGGQDASPAATLVEQGGKLYAVMQAALLHQRAQDALAHCPAVGRLQRFLDAYSPDTFLLAGKREAV